MEKTKKSPWWVVLKIFISIIAIIAILFVGLFAFIKIKYNINIFSAIGQLRSFGKEPNTDKIVDYGIADGSLDSALVKFDNVGLSVVYTKDAETGKVSFDPTKVTEAITMSANLMLSDKELGAIANNYIDTVIDENSNDSTDLKSLGDIEVVQIKISNVETLAGGYTSADLNVIIKLDLTAFKQKLSAFPLTILKKYIPNTLYINSTNRITMTGDFMYTLEYKSLTLNNLTSSQTQSMLNLLSNFIDLGNSQKVGETIGNYVCQTIIGGTDSTEGIAYALKPVGAKACGFASAEGVGYFVITINTSLGE